jgi:hypothetical protein
MVLFGVPFFLVRKQDTPLKNGTIPLKTGCLVTLQYKAMNWYSTTHQCHSNSVKNEKPWSLAEYLVTYSILPDSQFPRQDLYHKSAAIRSPYTHPLPVPRLRKRGAIPPLPQCAMWARFGTP